jgi:hypothetical protein
MSMHTRVIRHRPDSGWSAPLPTELDGSTTLLLAFATLPPEAAAAPLAELRAAFPKACLLGCSSSGEIEGGTVHDGGLTLTVVRFGHTRLRAAAAPLAVPEASATAGAQLAQALQAPDLAAVFLLSDGLKTNGTALARGLRAALGPEVVVTGGLAGDGDRFAHTWVVHEGAPQAGWATAVGLYGTKVRVSHGCDGGWTDFGPERRVTRSRDNVLYELDGQPALALYKRYLGERAAGLPGTALLFPLAIRRAGERDGDPLVRTILAIDEEAQSMTFAGDIPEGSIARLMRASTERLVDSAGEAGTQAGRGVPSDTPALALSVSCVGRRLVLGERTDEEVEMVQSAMPAGTAHAGFYSYGEIAPSLAGGAADLHNQTMTVTVVYEA